MAQFASDSFSGTSGTELTAYNAAWVKHVAASTAGLDARISNAARVRGTGGGSGAILYTHSATPASADYSVSVDVTEIADEAYGAGPVMRCDLVNATYYAARWFTQPATDVIQLFKFVAGTATQLGTDQPANFTTGTTRNLKLECIGTAIKVYIDGSATPIISVVDAAITAVGKGGIRLGYGGAAVPSDANTLHLDNYSADTTGVAGITGTVAAVNINDIGQAIGEVLIPITGTVAAVNNNDIGQAVGTVFPPPVTGTVAAVNNDDIGAAIGFAGEVTGTVAAVNNDDTAFAFGIVGRPEPVVTGGHFYGGITKKRKGRKYAPDNEIRAELLNQFADKKDQTAKAPIPKAVKEQVSRIIEATEKDAKLMDLTVMKLDLYRIEMLLEEAIDEQNEEELLLIGGML